MPDYIDIHSHRKYNDGCFHILSLDTHEFDRLDSQESSFSLGLHPWFIDQQDCNQALEKIALAIKDDGLMAIGECGLDKLIKTPMNRQLNYFEAQAIMAKKSGKPLIIHCVRAFNELFQVAKKISINSPWIIHGFNAKKNIAAQLLNKGFYLSFGKALLNRNSNAALALQEAPLSQVFLETDDAQVELKLLYSTAAKIKQIDLTAFQNQIQLNFARVFVQ